MNKLVLLCGHPEDCMYRYRHRGALFKYCMACIAKNFPEAELGTEAYVKANTKQEEKPKTKKKKIDEKS